MLIPRPPHPLGADRPVVLVASVKCGSCGRAVGDLIAAAETLLEATPAELRWRGKPTCTCPTWACKATDLGVVLARAQRLGRPTTWRLTARQSRPLTPVELELIARRRQERQPLELARGRHRKLTRDWSPEQWSALYRELDRIVPMPPDEPERH